MSVYIIPAEDAAALNAHVSSEYGQMLFAIEDDEHGWTFDDSAFPPGFDFDAVIAACALGSTLAGYLADKPPLSSRHCQIYSYLPAGNWDKLTPPMSVDYRTGLVARLERKTTFDKGELTTVEYYATATRQPDGGLVYAGGPVIREDYSYVRDAIGLAQSRTLKISWMLNDGTEHPLNKTMPKSYDRGQSMQEGKRRRGNVLDGLEVVVAGLLLETELANHGNDVQVTVQLGRELTSLYGSELRDFVNVAHTGILQAIADDIAHPWLNNLPPSLGGSVSIRAAILATVDIWG